MRNEQKDQKISIKYKELRAGFTLVEFAIVIVIVGLILAGVSMGADLIRQYEVKSVMAEYQEFYTAIGNFQTKYHGIPGDLSKAEQYWGTAHATNADCITTDSGDEATCNGDGDRMVEAVTTRSNEQFRFWQHLSNAGFIAELFTGTAGGGGTSDAEVGTNVPRSSMGGNSGWFAGYLDNSGGTVPETYRIDYGNYLMFGTDTADEETYDPALTPAEAYAIDLKMDDGLPGKGLVIGRSWNDTCASADDGGSSPNDRKASYNKADDSTQCALYFRDLF